MTRSGISKSICTSAAIFLAGGSTICASGVLVDFPTPNRTLLENRPEAFYMYVDRNFEGRKTQPWQGGQYGFVRGPKRRGSDVVMTSWHEGIDIRPLRRDPAGNPIDPIFAVADGRVVHVSDKASASNYGRYVVIEHQIAGSPFYSLYAHLAAIQVKPGDTVRQGGRIGVMGYTGSGLNRERAHLHFEFAFQLSPHFNAWQQRNNPASANVHGNYHGWNLVGTNPAALLVECAQSPGSFNLFSFLRRQPVFFKLELPNSANLNLLRNYPWLVDRADAPASPPPAWTISFTRYGTPVRAEPLNRTVPGPRVSWVEETSVSPGEATRSLLAGTHASPTIGRSGRTLLSILYAAPDGTSPY